MGSVDARKGGGPAIVLVALLTPWQAQWALSSINEAEGRERNLGEPFGKQADRSVPRLR